MFHIADKESESWRIPAWNLMFSLFLPPKIASAVQLYGDVTIFDASASFLSIPSHGMLKKREPNTLDDTWIQFKVKQIMPEKLQTWKPPSFNRCAVKYEILLCKTAKLHLCKGRRRGCSKLKNLLPNHITSHRIGGAEKSASPPLSFPAEIIMSVKTEKRKDAFAERKHV